MSVKELVVKFFGERRHAYQVTFRNPPGEAVLRDLAKFCRAHGSTFHSDERISAALQGRHEVWLRIQHYLNLSPEELWELYGKRGE